MDYRLADMAQPEAQTSPQKSAVLIGHSHSFAISSAAEEQSEIHLICPNLWLETTNFGYDEERDVLYDEIVRVVSKGTIISALGGFVHAQLGLIQHPDPFDFILPDAPNLPLTPHAQILPYAVIRDAASEHLFTYHRYMELVRKEASGVMYHLEAPPILADDAQVHEHIPWGYPHFEPRGNNEVSPAHLRWKLWRLASDLTREFCESNDMTFIPCPPASMDEHQYLRPEFYSDSFHANAAYGALVIEQIKGFL